MAQGIDHTFDLGKSLEHKIVIKDKFGGQWGKIQNFLPLII